MLLPAAVRCQGCRHHRLLILPLLLPGARVLFRHPTVSDQPLILLKSVHVSVCVCVVTEVKVNLIRCDIRGVGRE